MRAENRGECRRRHLRAIVTATTKQPPDPPERIQFPYPAKFNSLLGGAMIEVQALIDQISRKSMADPSTSAFKAGIDKYRPIMATAMGYAWIVTTGNSRRDQLEAGRRYVRMNLAANTAGLSVHPASQALQEFAEMREQHNAVRFHLAVANASNCAPITPEEGSNLHAGSHVLSTNPERRRVALSSGLTAPGVRSTRRVMMIDDGIMAAFTLLIRNRPSVAVRSDLVSWSPSFKHATVETRRVHRANSEHRKLDRDIGDPRLESAIVRVPCAKRFSQSSLCSASRRSSSTRIACCAAGWCTSC